MRLRSSRYLSYIRTLPCLICGQRAIAHHLMSSGTEAGPEPSAMAEKSGDDWTAPLCPTHHLALHNYGHEPDWWLLHGIAIVDWCQETYTSWLSAHTGITKPTET